MAKVDVYKCLINAYILCSYVMPAPEVIRCFRVHRYVVEIAYKAKAKTPLPISPSDWLFCQGVAQHIVVKFNPPTSSFLISAAASVCTAVIWF